MATLSDSLLSSSELRRRYLAPPSKGGIADSELSAAQLRSRYGLQNRKPVGHPRAVLSPSAMAMLMMGCALLLVMLLVMAVGTRLFPS